MTRDDIIRMAREAGLEVFVFDGVEEIGVGDGYHIQTDLIERFAALVAAAEREACAQVAAKMLRFYTQAVTGVPEAIRARGTE